MQGYCRGVTFIMKTKSLFFHLLAAAVLASAALPTVSSASIALPVRNRLQWLGNNGYCGETSLQECALYHGIYVSQGYVRSIYDPSQQNDLVEIEEWGQVLTHLGLTADVFPTESVPEPQYRAYAVWLKRHLEARHPVIVTCYVFEKRETDDPVDHIMTISGYLGKSALRYSDDDTFVINDHFRSTAAYALRSQWAFDYRSMLGNGAIYGIALQKERNYGLAITGTVNRSPFALPVRVELDRIDEPELIANQQPVDFAATVTVENLVPGKNYVLYRYDSPEKVPLANYASSHSDDSIRFKAKTCEQSFPFSIRSDSVAVFRCLPVGK